MPSLSRRVAARRPALLPLLLVAACAIHTGRSLEPGERLPAATEVRIRLDRPTAVIFDDGARREARTIRGTLDGTFDGYDGDTLVVNPTRDARFDFRLPRAGTVRVPPGSGVRVERRIVAPGRSAAASVAALGLVAALVFVAGAVAVGSHFD